MKLLKDLFDDYTDSQMDLLFIMNVNYDFQIAH